MDLPILIDTAISIVTVIILISVIASGVFELLGQYTKARSKLLRKAIGQALHDPGVKVNYAELLYNHPQVKALHKTPVEKPSYIPPKIFSEVLTDVVIEYYKLNHLVYDRATGKYIEPADFIALSQAEQFKKAVEELKYTEIGDFLRSFQSEYQSIVQIQTGIANWFSGYMERVGGWFKRKSQGTLLAIGFLIAGFGNIDLIKVTSQVYEKEDLRNELVTIGLSLEQSDIEANTKEEWTLKMKNNMETLGSLGLPIGWGEGALMKIGRGGTMIRYTFWDYPLMVIGWLITAFAVSRGAPFWFNMLSKFINLRSTGETKTSKP